MTNPLGESGFVPGSPFQFKATLEVLFIMNCQFRFFNETNMLLRTQTQNENNFQQHVSSIRQLKKQIIY